MGSRHLLLGVVAIASLLCGTTRSSADDKNKNENGSGGGYTAFVYTYSHDGDLPHWIKSKAKEGMLAKITGDSPSAYNSYGGVSALKQRPKGDYETPLCGKIRCSATRVTVMIGGQPTFLGWDGWVDGEKESDAVYRSSAYGHWTCGVYGGGGGGAVTMEGDSDSAHGLFTPILICPLSLMATLNWDEDAPAIVTSIRAHGRPELVEVSQGVWEVELDENGDVVWDLPPSEVLRLTSEVAYNGSGSVTYTYTLENLTSTDRNFEFKDVRTASFSSGWSGMVAANDSEQISDTVSNPGQDLWSQATQADFQETTDEAGVWTLGTTANVYIPKNRAAFTGTTAIQSASYSSGTNSTTVTFQVSTSAAEAHLYRTHNDQTTLVDSLVQALAGETDYDLEDVNPPVGTSSYIVHAGVRTNGTLSEAEEATR